MARKSWGKRRLELTPQQRRVLRYIMDFTTLHGMAPSYPEIAAAFGFATETAINYVEKIQSKGFIERTHGRHRSIRVVKDPDGVPVQLVFMCC